MRRRHAITTPISASAPINTSTFLPLTFETLAEWERPAIRSVVRALNRLDEFTNASELHAEIFLNAALLVGMPSYLDDSQVLLAANQIRQSLEGLVHDGSLTGRDGGALAATFQSEVMVMPTTELTDGHARITWQPRFKSAVSLIAYAVLRLSEISAHKPALLICEECEDFKIIEFTGGDRLTRFCSARCRNRFTVREWRAANPSKPKKVRKPK